MRRIGIVTSGRCDYGLYFPILKRIAAHPDLELSLYVTGMHLSDDFGNTVKIIQDDGFSIKQRVEILSSLDSPYGIARAMGVGTAGFAKIFRDNPPDILVVLGDRFEMHCAAIAAIPFNIPIAHIHGGEITYGAFDEQFRHSLTKLSHIHFVSTNAYAQRLRQMGEEPWRIIVSGAPGLDNVLNLPIYLKEELETRFKINLSKPVFLITFHPITLEYNNTQTYISNLLDALEIFNDYNIVFTSPNADTGYKIIIREIKSFVSIHPNTFYVDNFGQQGYLSMMQHSVVMIGNSSSGIIEAASFKLPVVNIGTRQEGRIRSKNVIDVGYASLEIIEGIKKALSEEFRISLGDIKNLHGDGKASEHIVSILANVDLERLKAKRFCDLRITN